MQKVSPGAEHTRKGRTDMAEETNFSRGEAEEVKYQGAQTVTFLRTSMDIYKIYDQSGYDYRR